MIINTNHLFAALDLATSEEGINTDSRTIGIQITKIETIETVKYMCAISVDDLATARSASWHTTLNAALIEMLASISHPNR